MATQAYLFQAENKIVDAISTINEAKKVLLEECERNEGQVYKENVEVWHGFVNEVEKLRDYVNTFLTTVYEG